MGYDLPAAIGAAVAGGGRRVICFAGDGSLQMNIQELQTVALHRWPIKIIVLNNGGYLSMRQTQRSFFGRLIGESPESGVSFPDFVLVAQAYGIPARRIESHDSLDEVDKALNSPGPALCEVVLDPEQAFEPKTSSKKLPDGRIVSAPLEDMWPFLDRTRTFEQSFHTGRGILNHESDPQCDLRLGRHAGRFPFGNRVLGPSRAGCGIPRPIVSGPPPPHRNSHPANFLRDPRQSGLAAARSTRTAISRKLRFYRVETIADLSRGRDSVVLSDAKRDRLFRGHQQTATCHSMHP